MDYNLINRQYQDIIEKYSSHDHFESKDSPLVLMIKFGGLTNKEEFSALVEYTEFETFVEYSGTSRELPDFIDFINSPKFTYDLSESLITMKFNKTSLPSNTKLFFIANDLKDYLNSDGFDKEIFALDAPLNIYTADIKSFKTEMVNFINLTDSDINKPSSSKLSNTYLNNYGNHVADTNIPKLLISLMLKDIDVNCPVQKAVVLKSYIYFLKLIATNNQNDNSYELQGKRNIKISTVKELVPNNWDSLNSLTGFLLTGGEFLEKFIIIKNVVSLYLNTNSSLNELDEKLKDIYETSQHYFNNYIQDDLESFFDLRNTLYKETINISFTLQKNNDRILNYIYGTLLGFILLIATTYLKLLEKENMIFFLLIIIIFCIFSFIIYFTLKKNVNNSFEIINVQFNFFSSKILILPFKEKNELREKFIDIPAKKVNETLIILKWILLGLNFLIFTIFLSLVSSTFISDTVPWWLKIIIYLLGT